MPICLVWVDVVYMCDSIACAVISVVEVGVICGFLAGLLQLIILHLFM